MITIELFFFVVVISALSLAIVAKAASFFAARELRKLQLARSEKPRE